MIANDATLDDAALKRFAKRFAEVSTTDRKRIHRLLLAEMKRHPREVTDNRDVLNARLSVEEKAQLRALSRTHHTSVSALIRNAVRDFLRRVSPTHLNTVNETDSTKKQRIGVGGHSTEHIDRDRTRHHDEA